MVETYLYSNRCYDVCPSGTYISGINCADCTIPSCTKCLDSSTCLECQNSYLLDGECVAECPSTYYVVDKTCVIY